jgi:hypothetical protein
VEKVSRNLESTRHSITRAWTVIKAKVAEDMSVLKARVAQTKHEVDVKVAEMRADDLE